MCLQIAITRGPGGAAQDKRHRSSSSLAGAGIEGTRSERKLDIRALIPEVDDHFALAETRCDELQEKIDAVKVIRRKKKLNKRSMTRLNEQPTVTENVPFISVRTQPKKKVSQQATRLQKVEVPQNPTRGYLDPATVEQHRMLGQVWDYGRSYNQANEYPPEPKAFLRMRGRETCADGDGMYGLGAKTPNSQTEAACGQDDDMELNNRDPEHIAEGLKKIKQTNTNRVQGKSMLTKKKNYPRENSVKDVPKWIDTSANVQGQGRTFSPSQYRRRQANNRQRQPQPQQQQQQRSMEQRRTIEEQAVVELFNKSRNALQQQSVQRLPGAPSLQDRAPPGRPQPSRSAAKPKNEDKQTKRLRDVQKSDDYTTIRSKEALASESKKEMCPVSRRVRYRSRGYEMPTVASQMKQADIRYHGVSANCTNIPFIVSKSTAPSHNIGVNIQQVLNGLKIKQPLSGIPLTIAHHMGLGHVSTYGTKSVTNQPSLDNREINAIKLGERLLHLPSYKYISYNRMLALYREGDGMVPRFLRAISRPNHFYTSMCNLATNREEMKSGIVRRNTKRDLAEYSCLYREYERLERQVGEGGALADVERRRDYLLRELASKEDYIRQLVQDSSTTKVPGDFNMVNLRASVSTANDDYRHPSYKHNAGDIQQ